MKSFYFYDLETSGINPKTSRIMQFAGQRTDMDLKPIEEPDNFLIKMTPDVLPEPDAVMITGITPQQTLAEGISEAEFLKFFYEKVATQNTIFTGFNNIRFDDEFLRYLNYRNFYDAYEWHWQNGRGRWDLLDATRMTRALRPDGIKWPTAPDGKKSNRLELLASENELDHSKAHDAMSDVEATIALAGLMKQKQPKIFNYLLEIRDKKNVEKLVSKAEPYVYTSGRYSSDSDKTTVVVTVADHPTQKGSVLVYDLMTDPAKYLKMSVDDLTSKITTYIKSNEEERFPVKILQFNRCPAVAPMSVLDKESRVRLGIDLERINKNVQKLLVSNDFPQNLKQAYQQAEKQRQSTFLVDIKDVDSQLYDGFFGDDDQDKMQIVRNADENHLADLNFEFHDKRLEQLLLLYKARQYPKSLSEAEQKQWEEYRKHKLFNGENSIINKYFARIGELSIKDTISNEQKYLLEELRLYGESLIPY